MRPRESDSIPAPRPLRWMVLDFDSFFASIEQTERPELRGRPVGVAPMESDGTSVIAASYEARRFGVRCGTLVADAKILCPEITIVGATPMLYTAYRKRVDEVISDVLPLGPDSYIDEVQLRLLGDEMRPANAREIALTIKARLRKHLGPVLTGSIGVAPNRFLGKVGADMGKPNGLTLLESADLPGVLYGLKLRDLPGINWRMEIRFNAAGIFTIRDLCEASALGARRGAGSVLGEQWWHLLRGEELVETPTRKKSLGHSHVLGGELRNRAGVKAVMLRLLGKALARLRSENLWAGGLGLFVSGGEGWKDYVRLDLTCDDREVIRVVRERLENADYSAPKKIGLWFDHLHTAETLTGSLFQENSVQNLEFGAALDKINQRYGKHAVYVGSIHDVKGSGDEKIAFGKKDLFKEGRGDHEVRRPLAYDPPPPADPYAGLRTRRAVLDEAARRFGRAGEQAFFESDITLDADELAAIRDLIDAPREDEPMPSFGAFGKLVYANGQGATVAHESR